MDIIQDKEGCGIIRFSKKEIETIKKHKKLIFNDPKVLKQLADIFVHTGVKIYESLPNEYQEEKDKIKI